MSEQRVLKVGDIVRIIGDDGSKSDELYLITKMDGDMVMLKATGNAPIGPIRVCNLYYQSRPDFLQVIVESKEPERNITVDTGFMTAGQMEEWCNNTYEVKNTDFGTYGVECNMLTHYSGKGYLCESLSLYAKMFDGIEKHKVVAQFIYKKHQPRNYNIDEDDTRFVDEIRIFREGYKKDGWYSKLFPCDYNFE